MGGGDSPRDSLGGIYCAVRCLQEEWASPQYLGHMGTPEVVKLDSLGNLSAHGVAGNMGWLFLTSLERREIQFGGKWQNRETHCGIP